LIISNKLYPWFNITTTFDLADYSRLIDAKVQNPEAQKALDELKIKDQQLNNLRAQIQDKYSETLAQQIRTLEEETIRQKEAIINRYPEVAELLETKTTDVAQLQKSIPANTVVIQPALLTGIKNKPDTVALFVITPDKLTVIQNPLPSKFNQLLDNYRTQLETADAYLTLSTQLYDIFIRPLEQQWLIPANSEIAIIATSKLREIPLETLYDSQTDKYLLEKYPIHYLTRLSKAQNLNNKPQNTTTKPRALALANPLPTQQELKNTELEAD
jgi:CHAT domain-containing protein